MSLVRLFQEENWCPCMLSVREAGGIKAVRAVLSTQFSLKNVLIPVERTYGVSGIRYSD